MCISSGKFLFHRAREREKMKMKNNTVSYECGVFDAPRNAKG